ncbi:MAPEG family protein [Chenggangzhangella methanolivorans]|uniref:MAPEG family protein n=1 Tax=Chenggangzhangella methanolivorans TaxID=1437009 RepID=A0A9E6RCA2_9HYPH|nr:MAPEG family protein [Chenggangzhangella methanolivorans]QZO02204.1 MAPEG family protein [Chenggangzhangella methanolivorans]
MTIALWCVLAAGLMPILCAGIAKAGASDFDNAGPREWLARQEGWRKRANAAQNNAWEAFPLFAVAVLVATVKGGPASLVDSLALAWILFRVGYVACYLADRATPRSACFAFALFTTIAIFVSPLWA